jgi:hypothetical protein
MGGGLKMEVGNTGLGVPIRQYLYGDYPGQSDLSDVVPEFLCGLLGDLSGYAVKG